MRFGKGEDVDLYVKQLSEASKIPVEKIHKQAFNAPERFENAFKTWQEWSKTTPSGRGHENEKEPLPDQGDSD
jgi:hypothetical protein